MYDTLYKNAKIITMDPSMPTASWVATEKGKIIAVGNEDDPMPQAKKTVDMKQKSILPGLIDTHAHGTSTGFALKSVRLDQTTNLKQVLELMKEGAAKDGDEWVFGSAFSVQAMDEDRAPTRWELDEISGDHPVMIQYVTLHGAVVNTKAMEMLKIPESIEGVIKNDKGELTGEYRSDDSCFLAMGKALGFLEDEKIEEFIKTCADYAASKGVTTLHSLDGQFVENDRDFFMWLNLKDSLPIRTINYFQSTNIELAKALKLPRIGGCLTLDGAGFEATMAVSEPFPFKPDSNGDLYWTDEEVYEFVSKVNKAGLQCGMHALGDRAIDQLLDAYERVIEEQGNKDLRHRIEHFSLCTPSHMERAAKLGLSLTMQPIFPYLWDDPNTELGDSYNWMLGKKRASEMEPFTDIIKAGGIVAGGSDSPVTLIDPVMGIHAAANQPNPIRNVSIDEAIKMFTLNAAWVTHDEDKKGSIEIGKLADFTVLDRNPYEEPENIKDFQVEMTIVDDKAVYVKDDNK